MPPATTGKPLFSLGRMGRWNCLSVVAAALLIAAGLENNQLYARDTTPSDGAPEWENQHISGVNKLPGRTQSLPFPDRRLAGSENQNPNPWKKTLNGVWKFHWAPDPAHRPVDFYKPDYDVAKWSDVAVPGNWQTQGFGTPLYSNEPFPFKADPPRVMGTPDKSFTNYEASNPVGSYRRTFTVPATWDGRHVLLQFNGVDSAFYLWVNGQKVGYSEDSRTPAIFDITKYLKPGENALAVEVYRYSDGAYFEDQDMWRLSGIFREESERGRS